MNDEQADQQPQSPSFFAVFPLIMLPMFLAVIDQTMVATALPAIASALGGVDRVSWIVIAYLVSGTIAAPVYGKLRDVVGGRPMMLVALAIYIAASVLCAVSTSILMLTAARVLQGLGGGGLMTLSQALIGEALPPRQRARYQGYLAAVAVTSSTLGPVVGGILTEHIGWRAVFLVNLPVGVLAMLLTLRLPTRAARSGDWAFDWSGLALFAGFIAPTLIAIYQVQSMTGAGFTAAAGLFAAAVLCLALLVRRERVAPHPLFEVALLKRPSIWCSDAMAAFHGATLVSLITFLPIYVHFQFDLSASRTGLLLLPMMFGIGTCSMLTGRLVSRTGQTMIFPSLTLGFAVFFLLVLAIWADRLTETKLLLLLVLIGFSMGTVMGVVQVTVQVAAGGKSLGAASASVQIARSLGAAIGTAIVGSVLFATLKLTGSEAAGFFAAIIQQNDSVLGSLTPDQALVIKADIANGFRSAFFSIAMFAALTLIFALLHPQRRI